MMNSEIRIIGLEQQYAVERTTAIKFKVQLPLPPAGDITITVHQVEPMGQSPLPKVIARASSPCETDDDESSDFAAAPPMGVRGGQPPAGPGDVPTAPRSVAASASAPKPKVDVRAAKDRGGVEWTTTDPSSKIVDRNFIEVALPIAASSGPAVLAPGNYYVAVTQSNSAGSGGEVARQYFDLYRMGGLVSEHGGHPVTLQRGAAPKVPEDEWVWVRVFAAAKAFSYNEYRDFVKSAFCDTKGVDAYDRLKRTSEQFMARCSSPNDMKPYIIDAVEELRRRLERTPVDNTSSVPKNVEIAGNRLPRSSPLYVLDCLEDRTKFLHWCPVELIWSYWHEEAMLVQTMKAITRRFQNRRSGTGVDHLINFEIDPLRPLNPFLWGYIEDEQHRLSVIRRAHEYEHHYGLPLRGKAVRDLMPADRRSKFIESFHNLLFRCVQFYRQLDDLTVHPDGFPVLNSIKETHYLVAQGAHNQYGDLPEVARREMLNEQYLLGRTEMRDFLRARDMVPYPEDWMDRVDAMKNIQGWIDTSVVHFHDLAVFGEQIVLSIRNGTWAAQTDPEAANSWARVFRQEIQGYIHAYRAVTGVDLTTEISHPRQSVERYAAPSEHLQRRLSAQNAAAR